MAGFGKCGALFSLTISIQHAACQPLEKEKRLAGAEQAAWKSGRGQQCMSAVSDAAQHRRRSRSIGLQDAAVTEAAFDRLRLVGTHGLYHLVVRVY